MQWDHLPGTPKLAAVSELRSRSKATILDEIEKCELVCTNCHTIRTFERAGWSKPTQLREARRPYFYTRAVSRLR
jgi:hypothetical protein